MIISEPIDPITSRFHYLQTNHSWILNCKTFIRADKERNYMFTVDFERYRTITLESFKLSGIIQALPEKQ